MLHGLFKGGFNSAAKQKHLGNLLGILMLMPTQEPLNQNL